MITAALIATAILSQIGLAVAITRALRNLDKPERKP